MILYMEMLKEIVNDTFMILPLLFISYLIIELIEQRNKNIDKLAYQLKKFGPLYGALMGLIPQCGFSVLAATLFIDKKITLGTLIAIFISTSDEAVPIMISDSSLHKPLLLILCGKLILAILIGYLCDALFEKNFPIDMETVKIMKKTIM